MNSGGRRLKITSSNVFRRAVYSGPFSHNLRLIFGANPGADAGPKSQPSSLRESYRVPLPWANSDWLLGMLVSRSTGGLVAGVP